MCWLVIGDINAGSFCVDVCFCVKHNVINYKSIQYIICAAENSRDDNTDCQEPKKILIQAFAFHLLYKIYVKAG